ncbi:hypothetical protein TNCT_722271 [Trichonephila clavata]|uniref:Uncharacterized protein n=1 Tax=Trichonephila clavata TaxID=2740835 RepID=A0A8X6HJU2_TRICU|nr:hypothetical protein TNCT_722271 [Trichonephila clavata]
MNRSNIFGRFPPFIAWGKQGLQCGRPCDSISSEKNGEKCNYQKKFEQEDIDGEMDCKDEIEMENVNENSKPCIGSPNTLLLFPSAIEFQVGGESFKIEDIPSPPGIHSLYVVSFLKNKKKVPEFHLSRNRKSHYLQPQDVI